MAHIISRHETEMMHKSRRALDSGLIEDSLEKLRHLCLAKGNAGILSLGRWFRMANNNDLNVEEFSKILNDAEIGLAEEETQQVFNLFDAEGAGKINVTDFLSGIRPQMSQSRKDIINLAFCKLDKTSDGVISVDDLKHVYCVNSNPKYISGVQSEEMILNKFLANFEENGNDGIVTKEEFENYYAGISAAIDNDMYFDLVIRQLYKL